MSLVCGTCGLPIKKIDWAPGENNYGYGSSYQHEGDCGYTSCLYANNIRLSVKTDMDPSNIRWFDEYGQAFVADEKPFQVVIEGKNRQFERFYQSFADHYINEAAKLKELPKKETEK